MKWRFIPQIVVVLSLSLVLVGAQEEQQSVAPKVRTLFEQIESHFASFDSLAYSVERTSKMGGRSEKERWVFGYHAPDQLRIDYLVPHERFLVFNSSVLWEYLPGQRQALHRDFSESPAGKREEVLASCLARVAIGGLHLGAFEQLVERAVSVETNDAGLTVVEGVGPRYRLELDLQKKTLVRTAFYDDRDQLLLSTKAQRFQEVAPGVWWPSTIITRNQGPDGLGEEVVTFKRVRVNTPFPEGYFGFEPPAGTEIINP